MGSYTLQDAVTYVWRALRDIGTEIDAQLLGDTEIETFISDATKTYSLRRERIVVVDIDADGTVTTALPAGWVDEVSRITQIEYPIGDTPPSVVDPRYYRLYQSPSGWTIRWLVSAPVSGTGNVRLSYNALRTYEAVAANTTVLDVDHESVAALAVSLCCDAIAGKFAQAQEPVLSADFAGASRTTKVADYRTLAKAWADRFNAHFASLKKPASGFVNWDSQLTGGGDWLTHPNRGR